MTDKNLISIVILTFNRKEVLREGLNELLALKYDQLEIVVVDNCSEDGTREMIRNEFPGVQLVESENNLGIAGRNLGLKHARGEIVVTLDDDVSGISGHELDYLRTQFSKHPHLGAVCFKVVHFVTGEVCNWCHHRRSDIDADNSFVTYEITEGAVAFRRRVLDASGYYPEQFFISHEGIDLAFRIMNAGYTVEYDGAISVLHKHDSSGRPNWRRYYFDTRNLFWVAIRNMPLKHASKYLLRGVTSMGVYSIRDGFFLYWLKGIRDGLNGISANRKERQPWTKRTGQLCREIDAQSPSFFYMVRQRLFKKGVGI